MEKVADRMKGLKLSVSEQKEVKVGWTDGKKVGMVEHQTMAKLMAEKPAFAEAREAALGRILCPMKGLEVKDLGENTFLFTFHQESGKKRALSEGPWSFAKSLLVYEDYDPDKTLKVGEFMAADVGANGMAIGKYLRIKVRIRVDDPLRRGFIPDMGTGTHECDCQITLAKGEKAQYSNWLRAYIPRGGGDPFRGQWESGRARRDGQGSGSNRRYSPNWGGSRVGSDSDNWRKKYQGKLLQRSDGGDVEENNAMKKQHNTTSMDIQSGVVVGQSFLAGENKGKNVQDMNTYGDNAVAGRGVHVVGPGEGRGLEEKEAAMQENLYVDHGVELRGAEQLEGTGVEMSRRKFKRFSWQGKPMLKKNADEKLEGKK
ncbi:putative caffeine synthase 2 [Hordeum vulgare]|nr:putative caffeine synthase 2 [Hordeum vulgare]